MPVFQKRPFVFFKRFPTAKLSPKMYLHSPSFSLWSMTYIEVSPATLLGKLEANIYLGLFVRTDDEKMTFVTFDVGRYCCTGSVWYAWKLLLLLFQAHSWVFWDHLFWTLHFN